MDVSWHLLVYSLQPLVGATSARKNSTCKMHIALNKNVRDVYGDKKSRAYYTSDDFVMFLWYMHSSNYYSVPTGVI